MATVKIYMPELSGTTGNVLWLRKSSDFTLVTSGGDALTESATTGWFTASVTETWAEQLSALVVDSVGLISRTGWLPVGADTVLETTAAVSITGGDATLVKQEEILTAITNLSLTQLAAITVESGVIANFPETLTIGDSYTSNTGRIKIAVTDSNGDPITQLGDLNFADADISFTAFRPGDSATVSGTCEFVDDVTETYVWLTLPSTQTILGKAEYTYEGRLKFFWQGPSSGTSDDEQKTYKTTPFKFISNP